MNDKENRMSNYDMLSEDNLKMKKVSQSEIRYGRNSKLFMNKDKVK